jgi:hypothetical protein
LSVGKRRRIGVDALRDLLDDLRGYSVGRVSFRSGRLIVWLRFRSENEPAIAIKLIGLKAFRDNGLGGSRLERGAVSDGGVLSKAFVGLRSRDSTPGLQLDLWSANDRQQPTFQALARDVRVYYGPKLTPDYVWSR